MNNKTAILIVNTGTPASPARSDVRRFLSQFLNDPMVINIPWILRIILVNLIIIPLRCTRTARRYKQLWTKDGSPLMFHGLSLKDKLQKELGQDFIVEFALNYQKPDIGEQLTKLCMMKIKKIILFPLFPQYSVSVTGSILEKFHRRLAKELYTPAVITLNQYYYNPLYIESVAALISEHDYLSFDHILFSFHGLPLRQIRSIHHGSSCEQFRCTEILTSDNIYCYLASSYGISRLLAGRLGLPEKKYTVCFQSRLSRNWLAPFTDEIIKDLAKKGARKILVACPSFTADCLETTVEVGIEYRNIFISNGGSNLTLVESLNANDIWVRSIIGMIKEYTNL